MKIGLLHYTMPPVIGGVERVIAAHVRLFREAGHEVVLLCDGSQEEKTAEFLWQRVPGFANGGDFRGNVRAFRDKIISQEFQVLIVHNVLTMPFCLAATAACHELAAAGFPIVSWVHDIAAVNPHYQIGHTGPENLLRKHPEGARIITISEERADAYRALTGFDEVTVIPNGIDFPRELAEAFFATRPALLASIHGRFPILLLPARLLRRKNIELGIQVVAELKTLGLSPRFLVSGASERFSGGEIAYRAELDRLASALGVASEVIFLSDHGRLSEADIGTLYTICDALFFPSEQEGFGLPILEAASRRVPVFASETQPLAQLAVENGLAFALTLAPAELARRIASYFEQNPASHIRQAIQRDFDWQGIYQRHILPLLQHYSP